MFTEKDIKWQIWQQHLHQGLNKTRLLIKDNYNCQGLIKDVDEFIENLSTHKNLS